MWDTVAEIPAHLSHEMPCPWCGHETHRFLPCSDRCACGGWAIAAEQDEPIAQGWSAPGPAARARAAAPPLPGPRPLPRRGRGVRGGAGGADRLGLVGAGTGGAAATSEGH